MGEFAVEGLGVKTVQPLVSEGASKLPWFVCGRQFPLPRVFVGYSNREIHILVLLIVLHALFGGRAVCQLDSIPRPRQPRHFGEPRSADSLVGDKKRGVENRHSGTRMVFADRVAGSDLRHDRG